MATKNTKKQQTKRTHFWQRHPRRTKWVIGILGGSIALIIAIYVAFQISPWPGSLFIRYEFTQGGTKTAAAMQKHVPSGITEISEQQYTHGDKDAYLDVFYPSNSTGPLPTVVWVHGGAWVSGDKDEVDPYAKIVASYGYTVVTVNYSIAPEKTYPTPIFQVNDALEYIQLHADRLRANPERIALAGDSAGSQIVAQMATIITSPSYATEMNITPALAAKNLKATVLNCGAYDLNLPNYQGTDGWFLHTVLWAYSGKSNFMNDPDLRHASVVDYVTKDFPPSFITAGNVDPLEQQSLEFAKKLTSLQVPTSTLFYPANYTPALNHEYQFNLDTQDGQNALKQMTSFLKERL